MMKYLLNGFRKAIRNYFGFSRKETNGTVLLTCLLVALVITPFLQNLLWTPKADLHKQDKLLQDSLVSLIRQMNISNEPTLPDLELSPFDPNKITLEDWLQFGLNKKVAERIERYKAKGGRFKRKEDLLRIYDFPQDLYDALEPYIQIERQSYRAKKKNFKKDYAESHTTDTSRKSFRKDKPQISKFDLNTADTAQLKRLRGIGEKRALNIVKFREKLGGFAQISQIEDVWGLDSVAIESIQKFAYIKPNSWKKIAINTANVEELKKHPYISSKLANVLVNYRLQHGRYNSAEDLRKVKILEESILQKILPYISFE